MGKRKAALAGRAWKLLRMALFWARKGGIFGRGLLQDLRFVPHQIRSLRAARSDDAIHVGEREFSLEETPILHFKMSRPRSARMLRLPCINPPVLDFDDDDEFLFRRTNRHHCSDAYQEQDDDDAEEGDASEVLVIRGTVDKELTDEDSRTPRGGEEVEEEEEKCIDVQAEEFIAKFYEQMKLQRQISLLQYSEMILRSAN